MVTKTAVVGVRSSLRDGNSRKGPFAIGVNAFQKHAVLPVAFSFGGGCEHIGDILHGRAVDAQQDEPFSAPVAPIHLVSCPRQSRRL